MNSKNFRSKEFLLYAVPVMLVDLLIHILAYKWVSSIFYYWDPADLVMKKNKIIYFLIVSYFIAVALLPVRLFKRGVKWQMIAIRAFFQTFVTLSLFALSIFILFGNFAGKLLLQDGILTSFLIIIWHIIAKAIILYGRRHGRNKVHAVIVGDSENALDLYRNLEDDGDYKVLGIFSDAPESLPSPCKYLGPTSSLNDWLPSTKVHAVYYGLSPDSFPELTGNTVRTCENLFVDFFYVPDMKGYLHRMMSFSQIGNVVVLNLREEPLTNPLNSALKRTFDLVASGLFLVTLYPLIWVFVAIGTKLTSPGPVLFRQQRTGYRGKPFTMLKFRSMKVNTSSDTLQATADDPRKTAFGDFLRRTSIDELPQFINVFRGEMSLIGPRPHMVMHTEMYNRLVDEYMVRHMVKPGLTGWAQVNGCRGETKEVRQMADRVRNDIWYIENWSPLLDMKIFIMTLLQILKGDEQAY